MAYEQVQKSFGKSSSQKKQSKFAPPTIDQQIETDSLLSAKVSKSIIPSKEERDAIRRSLFEKWGNATQKQDLTNRLQNVPASLSVAGTPIQAKLTIGKPGDKYEQEADRVAAQVVNQINAPVSRQPNQNLQREEMSEEDELQMKLETDTIQREDMPEEEEELQMKPAVQLQASEGGMAATDELETAIQQARGGGQALADNIREPMEQAFGTDFSGVKVHTDTQADQLNQSIQAKAFTTGQDVFFRSGEYKPGSRGGQELIAHELTHVVQQARGNSIQRVEDIHIQPTNDAVLDFVNQEDRKKIKEDVDNAMSKIKNAILNSDGSEIAKKALSKQGRDVYFYALFDAIWTGKKMIDQITEWDPKNWDLGKTGGLLLDIGLNLKGADGWGKSIKDPILSVKQTEARNKDHTVNYESDLAKQFQEAGFAMSAGPSASTGQLLRVLRAVNSLTDMEIEAIVKAVVIYYNDATSTKWITGQFHTAAEVWGAYEQYLINVKKWTPSN